jgi:predicted transcriptional regulator of viral defense system
MKFSELLDLVAEEPVFSSSLLLAGEVDDRQVRLQLSRWVKSGRLIQLRRGLYALAVPWRKVEPHPFLVANRQHPGSYVSLQSALAWYGAIPEQVPIITSGGTGRPETTNTPLGTYKMQHLTDALYFGFTKIEVANRQSAFMATPEKALLDLVHLTPGGDSIGFLQELRLQNMSAFQNTVMDEMAHRSGKPKLMRASAMVASLLDEDEGEAI